MRTETAAHECVSDEALQQLRLYKYSSVDKSLISRYILKHYVRVHHDPASSFLEPIADAFAIVEWLRRAAADVARAEPGDTSWVLFHTGKCSAAGSLRTRFGGTGE